MPLRIDALEMKSNTGRKRGATRRTWLWLLALAALGIILAAGAAQRRAEQRAAGNVGLTTDVQRGPLTISLVESGTIRNRERVIVRSEVEGGRNIIQLVDEGTMVEAGDLLVELDSSSLEEQRLEQEARLLNSEAAVIQSRESLEVVRNQAEADVARAELDLRFARMALDQYESGEYPQQLQQAEASITIAEEELRRARDQLEWSRTLETDGYITRSELEADELALKRRELDLTLARGKRDLLTAFTHVQALEKLKSDIQQAEMALERVRRRARADVIRAEADLRTKESDLRHQKNRLARLEDQIAKCRIVAPSSGMVIYATSVQTHRWRRPDPLEPGQTVRERQELIHLPTTGEMMVEITVQEASLPKIRVGLPARITLESGLDRVFSGQLKRIGILPDSTSMALNPDLKLYNCEVLIDESARGLRQGMSCLVELLVEQHDDVLYVPLQALVRVNGTPTLYVVGPRNMIERRAVSVGLDNGRMVHILDGVSEGERVLLAPPLTTSERRDTERDRPPEEAFEPVPDAAAPAAPAAADETPRARAANREPGSGEPRGGGGGRRARPE